VGAPISQTLEIGASLRARAGAGTVLV